MMATITEEIYNQVQSLPEDLQIEALEFVNFLQYRLAQKQTKQLDHVSLADILEDISQHGTAFSDIKDPVAWQREQRQDRELFGRE